MKEPPFKNARLACCYFFALPGICYALVTSRMPAIKLGTGTDDAQIGIALLCVGIASLFSLYTAGRLIERYGSRHVMLASGLAVASGCVSCSLASGPFFLYGACALFGAGVGLMDVAVNAHGIELEHHYKVHCMAFLHGTYSVGAVFGSLSGSVFAALEISPFVNALVILCLYACLWPLATKNLLPPTLQGGKKEGRKQGKMSFLILVCGVMAMLSFCIEGSVAEWGSLFMHEVKQATPQMAALVFACFSTSLAICRFVADNARTAFGDFAILLFGSLLAFCGLGVALASPNPWLCLAGYALMGFGMAPIVPILFSRAGAAPGISAAQALAMVAFFGYGGLLFFPPLLGFLAQGYGLGNALLVPLFACLAVAFGAFILRKYARIK